MKPTQVIKYNLLPQTQLIVDIDYLYKMPSQQHQNSV